MWYDSCVPLAGATSRKKPYERRRLGECGRDTKGHINLYLIKKKISKIKRVLALCLIFLLSINSFAAIVSDNDGSAFVTKAEFDALKKDFNEQINNYNTSIDGKIDGAIASYLSGLAREVYSLNTIHSDWDDVYFINQEIKPQFGLPEFVWMVGGGLLSTYSGTDKKFAGYAGFKKFVRTWGDDSDVLYRPTVGLINGNEETLGNMYWDGVSLRWKEQMYIGKYLDAKTGNMYGYSDYRAYILSPFTFSAEGYIKGILPSTFIKAKPKLQANVTGSGYLDANADNHDPKGQVAMDEQAWYRFFVTEDDLNGERKIYKHINVNDGDSVSFYVSNSSWVNRIYKNPDNTLTDKTLGDDTSVETHLHGSGNIFLNAGNYSRVTYNTMNFSYDNVIIPSIGMYESKVKAKDIYQKKYTYSSSTVQNDTIEWNGVKVDSAPALTLENGMEICTCKPEETYTYNVEFDYVKCFDGTSMVENNNEVDVYLSYVPFDNGVITSDPVSIEKGLGADKSYVTTVNRRASLTWYGVDSKVLVYMKCKPHWDGTEYMDKDFTIKLNTTNSNQVVVQPAK